MQLHGRDNMISPISLRTAPIPMSGNICSHLQRSVGGGSVIDTAKAANLCAARPKSNSRIDFSKVHSVQGRRSV